MILSNEIKDKIKAILNSDEFMNNLYEGLSKESREAKGQFYTPADVCIKMIEKFNFDTLAGKNILDPMVGSGNLLIACLIAGADTDKIFGNEYDARVIPTCRYRIRKALELLGRDASGFNDWQIHQGNALIPDCVKLFGPEYDETILKSLLKKRWGLEGGWMNNPERYKEPEQIDLFGGF